MRNQREGEGCATLLRYITHEAAVHEERGL